MPPEISRATDSTYERSASPLSVGGVPTATKMIELSRAASVKLSETSPMALEQFRQKLFVDGDFAGVQRSQFLLIVVDQDDVMAQIGEACACDQPNIPGTYNGDAHRIYSSGY